MIWASVASYVAFVLSLFVPHLSLFWYLGRAVLRDCGFTDIITQKSLVTVGKSKVKTWQSCRSSFIYYETPVWTWLPFLL